MNESRTKPRLAIVGTTASGKSKLAMMIAEKINDFEIISLDFTAAEKIVHFLFCGS